jgi:Secretion system C-terminal sorting domain
VTCLNTFSPAIYSTTFPYGCNWVPNSTDYYVKFLLNFSRVSGVGQNVLMVVKYPLELTEVTSLPATSGNCNGSYFVQATTSEITGTSGFCNQSFYINSPRFNYVNYNKPLNEETTEIKSIRVLKISPNPSNSLINIELKVDRADNLNISLIDVSGKRIKVFHQNYTRGSYRQSFDVSDIKPGIYLIEVQGKFGKKVERVSIIK